MGLNWSTRLPVTGLDQTTGHKRYTSLAHGGVLHVAVVTIICVSSNIKSFSKAPFLLATLYVPFKSI